MFKFTKLYVAMTYKLKYPYSVHGYIQFMMTDITVLMQTNQAPNYI